MNVKPLGDKILIKPVEQEEKTKGGIFIPDQAKEKTNQGEIVEVGPGKEKPIALKQGQKIIYEGYAGTEVKVNGEKHLILDVKDVLATIE